jgi:hypothetical protein
MKRRIGACALLVLLGTVVPAQAQQGDAPAAPLLDVRPGFSPEFCARSAANLHDARMRAALRPTDKRLQKSLAEIEQNHKRRCP